MSDDKNQHEIKSVLHSYFVSLYTKNIPLLRALFHESAWLSGFVCGQYECVSIADWLSKIETMPCPSERGDAFVNHVLMVDVFDKMAHVKLMHTHQGVNFVNFLSLIDDGECWRIVHKTFIGQLIVTVEEGADGNRVE